MRGVFPTHTFNWQLSFLEAGTFSFTAGVSFAAIDSHMVCSTVAVLIVNAIDCFTRNGNRFFATGRSIAVTISASANKAAAFRLGRTAGIGASD